MRKLVLGMGAAALMASLAFANDETTNTQVAASDTTSAAFTKLDADNDGRVSAIEAANNSSLAASFTQADMDKDGYLSRDEFKSLSTSSDSSATTTPSTQSDTSAPADTAAAPQQ